jgi:glycosyltransferase involved in cell wall biosynthesis
VRIAINTRFLLPGKMEGFGWYTYEVVKRIVVAHPEHEFFFFFDRPHDPTFLFSSNVTPVILRPAARHPFLFIWWFEVKVKRALKKYQIDLFFSPDGYLSLSSDVPQIGTIHDINFEHHPKDLPFFIRTYLRYFFPRYAKKAKHLLTVSEYSKWDICKTYGISENKITTIWNGASDNYIPLNQEEVKNIKRSYTGGKPYFIFIGSIHPRKNLPRLLSAFRKFKTSLNSEIKMIIVGSYMWRDDLKKSSIATDLGSDLIFTGHVKQSELVKLVGAAFALTYVPYYEGFGIPIVEAMKCGVPVIAGNKTSIPEVTGEAALLCNPFDTESICNAMIQLTSDEHLHSQLSSSGLERSKSFNWDATATKVWLVLEKALNH